MNNEQQKIIEIYRIVNMHDTNPEDTHFIMPNPFNAIVTPYPQMPGVWSVHCVSICLIMQLGYRLLLLYHRSLTWAFTLSSMLEELCKTYKVPYINVNLIDVWNNLYIILSKTTLLFWFPTSSRMTMSNELLDYFIRRLELTKKPILTLSNRKLLSNE